MEAVFISSVQSGFEDVRAASKRAIESVGMRALMAETAGASVASPQRALLDLVREADVFLLILGQRYSKPTDDEYEEAARLSKEIIVLRQVGTADPDQAEFVERVSGGWTSGRLRGTFNNANDAGFAVVQALTNRGKRAQSHELRPRAQEAAQELAAATSITAGWSGGPSVVRTVHVPLLDRVLVDALKLETPDLGDRIAALTRQHRLVEQRVGIDAHVSREGIVIQQTGTHSPHQIVEVRANGAVVCTTEVAGDDQFGSMRIDPGRLEAAIDGAGSFALAVWALVDDREDVQQVAVAVAIPNAHNKIFGASTGANSISMGSDRMPRTVVVPDPPTVVRRAEVGSSEQTRRLVAEVKRVFTDAGAIEK